MKARHGSGISIKGRRKACSVSIMAIVVIKRSAETSISVARQTALSWRHDINERRKQRRSSNENNVSVAA